MKSTGKRIAIAGVATFAAGIGLPFLVGTLIPPVGWNILQLGGPAVAVLGALIMVLGRKGK